MENAVEALKIAAAVLMFVVALSLSISSLSQANAAVTSITTMYDKQAQYNYVVPSTNLTRTVGVETIVSTMYRAYEDSYKVVFLDRNGNELPIRYKTDSTGSLVMLVNGEEKATTTTTNAIKVNYINLSDDGTDQVESGYGVDEAKKHLEFILAGEDKWKEKCDKEGIKMEEDDEIYAKYKNQLYSSKYPNGFYDYLSKHTFTEMLGEYYYSKEADDGSGYVRETKDIANLKRTIVYQQVD